MSVHILNNQVIQQRLLMRESAVGDGITVSKIATKLCNIYNSRRTANTTAVATIDTAAITTTNTADTVTATETSTTAADPSLSKDKEVDSLLRDLISYKTDMMRSCYVDITVYNNEIQAYKEKEIDIANQIALVQQNISNLQVELVRQKAIRQHRILLEEKATIINKLPNMNILNSNIEEMKAVLLQDVVSLAHIDGMIAKRCEQVTNLVSCIHALDSRLQEDEAAASFEMTTDDADTDNINADEVERSDGRDQRREEDKTSDMIDADIDEEADKNDMCVVVDSV